MEPESGAAQLPGQVNQADGSPAPEAGPGPGPEPEPEPEPDTAAKPAEEALLPGAAAGEAGTAAKPRRTKADIQADLKRRRELQKTERLAESLTAQPEKVEWLNAQLSELLLESAPPEMDYGDKDEHGIGSASTPLQPSAEALQQGDRTAREALELLTGTPWGSPELQAVGLAVDSITENDIIELRSLKKPPQLAAMTLAAVATLLGEEPAHEWATAQRMLADDSSSRYGVGTSRPHNYFLRRIRLFDKDSIPPERLQKLKSYVTDDDFTPEKVRMQSLAAEQLCFWCDCIFFYGQSNASSAQTEPKADALRAAEDVHKESRDLAKGNLDDKQHKVNAAAAVQSGLLRRLAADTEQGDPLKRSAKSSAWKRWLRFDDSSLPEAENQWDIPTPRVKLVGMLLELAKDPEEQRLLLNDLFAAQLRCATLTGAQLGKANLRDAQLERADLSKALLQGATLDGANLHKAKLESAQMQQFQPDAVRYRVVAPAVVFTGAALESPKAEVDKLNVGQEIVVTDSERVKFPWTYEGGESSTLRLKFAFGWTSQTSAGSLFTKGETARCGTVLLERIDEQQKLQPEPEPQPTTLKGAKIEDAILRNANMELANLTGATLKKAQLQFAEMRGAVLVDADLTRACLESAVLAPSGDSTATRGPSRADLTGATLYGADFTKADLTEACMERVEQQQFYSDDHDGSSIILSGTNLTRASLVGADLSNAHFTSVSNWQQGKEVEVRTTLVGAQLDNALLQSAIDLDQAQFDPMPTTPASTQSGSKSRAWLCRQVLCAAESNEEDSEADGSEELDIEAGDPDADPEEEEQEEIVMDPPASVDKLMLQIEELAKAQVQRVKESVASAVEHAAEKAGESIVQRLEKGEEDARKVIEGKVKQAQQHAAEAKQKATAKLAATEKAVRAKVEHVLGTAELEAQALSCISNDAAGAVQERLEAFLEQADRLERTAKAVSGIDSSSTAKQARKHIEAQFSAVENELRGSMQEWKKEQLVKLQAFKEEVFQPQAIKDALTSVRQLAICHS
eukprot:COSAG04_NODE_975_length_9058_cov_11.488894_4_plen_1027_part_00